MLGSKATAEHTALDVGLGVRAYGLGVEGFRVYQLWSVWGFTKIRGTFLGGLRNED